MDAMPYLRDIAKDTRPDGWIVSTIWFQPGGDPKPYETMVYRSGGATDYTERYATEDEARAGHARWLAREVLDDAR